METGNVNYILIWVPEESEKKLKNLFEKTFCEYNARKEGADTTFNWYLETVSRLHNACLDKNSSGMKPAGLEGSPVVLKAMSAIETGDPTEALWFIPKAQEDDFRNRFRHVMEMKDFDVNNVPAGRAYVAAFIEFIIYAHRISMPSPLEEDT